MPSVKKSLREICREVGVPHIRVTEVLRRVDQYVREDKEVITHEVGTFYLRKSKATERTLNGQTYQVPMREAVALRGRRFPGRDINAHMTVRTGQSWPNNRQTVVDNLDQEGRTDTIFFNEPFTLERDFGHEEWNATGAFRILGRSESEDPEEYEYEWEVEITHLSGGQPTYVGAGVRSYRFFDVPERVPYGAGVKISDSGSGLIRRNSTVSPFFIFFQGMDSIGAGLWRYYASMKLTLVEFPN